MRLLPPNHRSLSSLTVGLPRKRQSRGPLLQRARDFLGGPGHAYAATVLAAGDQKVPRIESEFWTSRQRQAHSLHEVSYRACFKPQLPRFFIERLTRPGGVVLDPFMGRGTTILEAALLGRHVVGNDINPLSRILAEPRLSPPTLEQTKCRLARIPWRTGVRADIDLSMFYSPCTETHVLSLRDYLLDRQKNGSEDAIDRWIRMVATNRLTGHSAGFFSVYTLPPNQAVSPDAQRKINKARGQFPPDRDAPSLILRKTRSLLRTLTRTDRLHLSVAASRAQFLQEDARALLSIPDDSVDLVVTSPPFLDVVQYPADNWLRCWFNGLDAEGIGQHITLEPSVEGWSGFVREVLRELRRVLRPGGWIAFEVGEVRKGTILLDEAIAPLGKEVDLECQAVLVNRQRFTKTSNCWGVDNNRLGTNTNRIVLFQKVV